MTSVDNVIARQISQATEAARAASAALPPAPVMETAPIAPGVYAQAPNAAVTLQDFLSKPAMLRVDEWLKLDRHGFVLKKALANIPPVGFKFSESRPFKGYRLQQPGGQFAYYKTQRWDVCFKTGLPWAEVVRMAQAQGVMPYDGYDLVFHLLAPATNLMKADEIIIPAGKRIGVTTSITNFGEPTEFGRRLSAAGLLDKFVEVKLVHRTRSNAANPGGWGLIDFGAYRPMSDEEAAAMEAAESAAPPA